MRKVASGGTSSGSTAARTAVSPPPNALAEPARLQQQLPRQQQQHRGGWPNIEQRGGQNYRAGEKRRDAAGDEHFEGFCIDLLKELAKLLNFSYDIELVDDGMYGLEVGRQLERIR